MNLPEFEAALVVLVPQAEKLVGPFREAHDPSAAVGVPAHITINYPFLAAADPDGFDTAELAQLFAAQCAFEYALASIRNFPGVLYLAPEPDEPFKTLIQAVESRYPGSPPYGGMFEEAIPHLTVADVTQLEDLPPIQRLFSAAAQDVLPISGAVDRVWLMDTRDGRWRIRESFRLGA